MDFFTDLLRHTFSTKPGRTCSKCGVEMNIRVEGGEGGSVPGFGVKHKAYSLPSRAKTYTAEQLALRGEVRTVVQEALEEARNPTPSYDPMRRTNIRRFYTPLLGAGPSGMSAAAFRALEKPGRPA